MKYFRRLLLIFLAILFLFEAWIWDCFAATGRWLAVHIPFARAKRLIEQGIAKLPPYAALVLFVIPGLTVLPFKLAGLWFIAHGHWLLGGMVFLAAKMAGVGVAAFLFELTRDKLMTLGWFVRLYSTVIGWRQWAHQITDPYLAEIKIRARVLKDTIKRIAAGERSHLARVITKLRKRIHRTREQD